MSKRKGPEATGILLVDKPVGWTSHDVVGRVRRLVGQRRVGHTGTLDPLATGLLVVCLGRATRLAEYVTTQDKRYEGLIQLGVSTITDDAEGDVIRRTEPPPIGRSELKALEINFTGSLQQRPPAFSAIRVNGRRAYAAARQGERPELQPRRVEVHRLALRALSEGTLHVSVHCGHGTYVRSLARDIGESLGCGAHLAGLRRTHVGSMQVTEAYEPEELTALTEVGLLGGAIQPPDFPLTHLDAALLSNQHTVQLGYGSEVRSGTARASEPVRVYGADGEFVAIAAVANGRVRPIKVIRTPSRS